MTVGRRYSQLTQRGDRALTHLLKSCREKLSCLGSQLAFGVDCGRLFFFFSSRRRHTRFDCDWSSDVCSSDLICANTRTPEVTWGDIKAQVNTNTYGLSKFADLFGKYGVDAVLACWARWMDICETELRKQIAAAPAGGYGPATDYLHDDGVDLSKPHPLLASPEVKGDTPHFVLAN